MTRKRFIKLTTALFNMAQFDYNGTHCDGKMLKWLTSRTIADLKGINSYQEAWDKFYAMRKALFFNERGKN